MYIKCFFYILNIFSHVITEYFIAERHKYAHNHQLNHEIFIYKIYPQDFTENSSTFF